MKKIKLRIMWSKKEEEFIVHYPTKADGHWAHSTFLMDRTDLRLKTTTAQHLPVGAKIGEMEWKWRDCSPHFEDRVYQEISYNLVEQLIDRGFDPKTLKIEVSLDPKKLATQFPHIYETLTDEEKARLDIA